MHCAEIRTTAVSMNYVCGGVPKAWHARATVGEPVELA